MENSLILEDASKKSLSFRIHIKVFPIKGNKLENQTSEHWKKCDEYVGFNLNL